jgi:hypothetical protein
VKRAEKDEMWKIRERNRKKGEKEITVRMGYKKGRKRARNDDTTDK